MSFPEGEKLNMFAGENESELMSFSGGAYKLLVENSSRQYETS